MLIPNWLIGFSWFQFRRYQIRKRVSATPVFAADGLDATIEAALSTGFANVASMVTAIVVLAIPTTLGIISLVGGAKTGIKWIKGAIAKAS